MLRFGRGTTVIPILLSLSSCSGGLTEIQASVAKFDQATHTAAAAQPAFLSAYQVSECRSTNFDKIFLLIDKKSKVLDLTAKCTPVGVTDTDIQIRTNLLAAVVLYADKLQTLASGSDIQKLDANSQNLAKAINSFGKSSGLITHAVETAIIAITDFVLEEKKINTIKDAAQKNQASLETVVAGLKDENTILGPAMQRNLDETEGTLKAVMARELAGRTPTVFLDIVRGQELIASYDQFKSVTTSVQIGGAAANVPAAPASPAAAANPAQPQGASSTATVCGIWSSAKPADQASPTPASQAAPTAGQQTAQTLGPTKPLDDALDSIVAGNRAIAETGPGGIAAAAEWISSCGQAANAIYTNLGK